MEDSKRFNSQSIPNGSHGETGDDGIRSGSFEACKNNSAFTRIHPLTSHLMEQVCHRDNLNLAYKRVKSNKGAAGVDQMSVSELGSWIRLNKEALIFSLLDGSYHPQPVRGVKIPKAGGKGKRQLGIPTVVDRLVQQAILQVLGPILERGFSESSFGFRPGRSAHDALMQASKYVSEGRIFVVDLDLEKFFDRVNHDMLMARLARHVSDKRLLRIVRGFLNAGLMQNGVVLRRTEGTPQGGPLSPLLANLLLDDLDKELERRGHRFCRYADDCNIYVQSLKSAQRIMASISRFLEKRLKLYVNRDKSAAAIVDERKFLGYRLFRDGSLAISSESLKRLKQRVRQITRRNRPICLTDLIAELNRLLVGWMNYYRFSRSSWILSKLDSWIRRKSRCLRLKQLKRAKTIGRFLLRAGVNRDNAWKLAGRSKGWWRMSGTLQVHLAMKVQGFEELGLVSLLSRWQMLQTEGNRRGAEQACPVV